MSPEAASAFPIARRIVTNHDDNAKAIFVREDCPHFQSKDKDAEFHFVWKTTTFPSRLDEETPEKRGEVHSPGGSLCRIVDMAPHSTSPMHRTVSLDYGIPISGRLWMVLDDGVEVELRPGDTVVQRGTIHAWVNKSDEWARIAFVLIDAEAPLVNGKPLNDPGFQL